MQAILSPRTNGFLHHHDPIRQGFLCLFDGWLFRGTIAEMKYLTRTGGSQMDKITRQFFVNLIFVLLFVAVSFFAGEVAAGRDAGICQIIFIIGVFFGLATYYLVDLIRKKSELDKMKFAMKSVPLFLLISFAILGAGCISDSSNRQTNNSAFGTRVNDSQAYFDHLVETDPTNATAWVIRGNYYNDAFNQYEKALKSYDRALELDPDYGYGWYSKGVTLYNMRRFNESKICFSNAIKYDPSLASVIPRGAESN